MTLTRLTHAVTTLLMSAGLATAPTRAQVPMPTDVKPGSITYQECLGE